MKKKLFLLHEGSVCKRSEEHTSELQSLRHLVCRLLLEKKKKVYDGNPAERAVRLQHGFWAVSDHPDATTRGRAVVCIGQHTVEVVTVAHYEAQHCCWQG